MPSTASDEAAIWRQDSALLRQDSAQAWGIWPPTFSHSSAQVSHRSAQTRAISSWYSESRTIMRACKSASSATSRQSLMQRARSASPISMQRWAHFSAACEVSKQLSTHSSFSVPISSSASAKATGTGGIAVSCWEMHFLPLGFGWKRWSLQTLEGLGVAGSPVSTVSAGEDGN